MAMSGHFADTRGLTEAGLDATSLFSVVNTKHQSTAKWLAMLQDKLDGTI